MLQHRWSIWSGVLGATASCLAKVAVSNDSNSPLALVRNSWCDTDMAATISGYVGGCLGRNTLLPSYVVETVKFFELLPENNEETTVPELRIVDVDWCSVIFFGPRILCFVSMLLLNAYMMAAFVKGMQHSGSLVGTSITTASNFSTSALLGAVVWKERFSSAWWTGFSTVLMGVILLSSAPSGKIT